MFAETFDKIKVIDKRRKQVANKREKTIDNVRLFFYYNKRYKIVTLSESEGSRFLTFVQNDII